MHSAWDGYELHARRARSASEIEVAVWRDGALRGADGLPAAERARLGWDKAVLVDHPQLAAWRSRRARLDVLAADPEAGADDFADAAVGFPFETPTGAAVARFTAKRPDRAAGLLDRADDLALAEPALDALIERARGADGLTDARLAGWARGVALRNADGAIVALARAPAAGSETAGVLLRLVGEVHGSDRERLYRAAGERLVARPENAAVLVGMLDELYGSDRADAALALLARPEASPAFAVAVIASIDDFYGDDRVAVLRAAAPAAMAGGHAALVVHATMEELYGDDRANVAVWLAGRADASPALVTDFARMAGDVYGSDRVRVIDALIDSPGFQGDAQAAVVRAVGRELRGDARAEAFARLAARSDLGADARALLDLERDRGY